MKLSTKGRYGLRAMVDLALNSGTEAISLSSIAIRQNISEAYLEQLMAKLKRAGLVISSRGAQGGYQLSRPADDISVGDILRALEGDLSAVKCPGFSEAGCETADLCVTKYVWKKINDSISETADEIKLEMLVEESRKVRERNKNSSREPAVRECCPTQVKKTDKEE